MVVRTVYSRLVDHPSAVTLGLVVLTAVYWLATWLWWPDWALPRFMDGVPPGDRPGALATLSLGVASVAAMVGGFAGVVVVFGLSSNDDRFRTVRVKAATSLRRNWMSIVMTPLIAAFGAVVAAALASAGQTDVCLWVLLGCLLLAAHGALRLVVLLSELVKVVHQADEAATGGAPSNDTDTMSTDDFYSE